ncbi:MAG TPA: DUF3857 domain-containing protein [Thermoanaerobaculia bacterium]
MPLVPRILLPFLLILSAATVMAQEPWDAEAFSVEPKALIEAAEKVPAGDSELVILLDERTYAVEADGRSRTTTRIMYRIAGESAVSGMGQVQAPWAPWIHERPTIEARVVTKDGTMHSLDRNAVTEAPMRDESLDIFSDNRVLRAPLPAVAVGSVVEYVIRYNGTTPIAGAGVSDTFYFGMPVPVHRARLVIDGPATLEPRIVNTTKLEAKVTVTGDRRRTLFESPRIEAVRDFEGYLPYDVAPVPYVAFSTGKSWQEIATRYEEIVEKQMAGSELKQRVVDAVGKTKDRREIVARLLANIQKDIRYAGVEVGEASIVPRTPQTVLTNKYGDCKDKATLLVAMLREAGVTAHVALLRAGSDFDVQPELPGIGRFNHAIVVVEGNPRIWVDPTDEFARAGELPIQDQGRLALIATKSTTALTKVPEAEASANLSQEIRSFELPEDGKSRVVETTESHGVNDSWQRRMYATADRTRYREAADEYAKKYYFAKSVAKVDATDPHDLTKPFRITMEVLESGSGIVDNGEGEVAFHPAGLVSGIPPQLRKVGKDAEDRKKRTHDFLMPAPSVKEWIYRIDPPAGFVARTLPPSETKKYGTTTLTTEYTTQSDGLVVAKVRFDSGKRRLTAAEFEETRDALAQLFESNRVVIGFESVGQTKLNAGDVAGALSEFRRLGELHPTHAQHHLELARTLLAGGLGDAAREAVRKAIEIEPDNWRVYEMQSRVLQHDLLARPFRRGFDLPGAIAAMRKAKELDPKNSGVRAGLARLLTFGEDGAQFGRNAKLTEAIDEYRALLKDLPDEGKKTEAELMLVLAHTGRFLELRELTKTMDAPAQRDMGRILAVAADAGAEPALRELGAFDANTRRQYAIAIGQTLVQLRKYAPAAALLDSALQGAPNAAEMRPYVETLKKAKRIEDVPLDENDPTVIVRKVFAAIMSGNRDTAVKLLATDVAQFVNGLKEEHDPFAPPHQKPDDMPPAVTADFVTSVLQVQKDGDDERGWRLRTRMGGTGERTNEMTFFVAKEDGRYVLRAVSHAPDLVGLSVLRFADAQQLERARTWLNWMREEITAGGGDDPLRGAAFPILWPKGKMTATEDEVRTAAASLMMRSANKTSEPILLAMREKSTNDDTKLRIDSTLAAIYLERRDWKSLETVAARLYERHPESTSAFMTYTTALTNNGKHAKADELAKKRLEATPNDPDALRAMSQNAAKHGDWKAAHDLAQQLVDQLSQSRSDYNNAAWFALFTGKDFTKALEQARYASENQDSSSLHTLAALYAETGNSIEARDALLRSMDTRGNEDPTGIDWYVLGRIAENYNLRDAALAAYQKAQADREDDDDSVLELTTRRLKTLQRK